MRSRFALLASSPLAFYGSGSFMAPPKSPSLAALSLPTKMLRDLMSLWMMLWLCRYCRPRQMWMKTFQRKLFAKGFPF